MTLKVIGVGLGRTGTASVKVALEMLGTGHGYHMSEVLQNPAKAKDWIDAANGNADWDKIFDGYGTSVDYPGCTFWQELADYYPDAKLLLTVRDPVRWFDSTNETIMSEMLVNGIKNSPFGELMQRIVFDTVENRMRDKDYMVDYFEKRNADIIASVPAERLLVYQVKEGWGPLCEFLGVPVPDEDFPHINSREETRLLIEKMTSGKGGMSEEAMVAAGKSVHGGEPG
jgi:hypothetical protein